MRGEEGRSSNDQRKALLLAPTSWFNVPDDHLLATALYATEFARGYRHQNGAQVSMMLTPLGLEAKAQLANTPTRD